MKKTRTRKFGTAFTFVELLIALTIFSIIASSIYYTLNTGARIYRTGNSVIRDNQNLRLFFNSISTDFKNAVVYSGTKPDWKSDRTSFMTAIDSFSNNVMNKELARVSYHVDEPGDTKKLIRECATVFYGFNDELAPKEVFLENSENFEINSINFKYCYKTPHFGDEYEWRDEWDKEKFLPRGVKVTLILKNKETGLEKIFEKTILIPMGELGGEEL